MASQNFCLKSVFVALSVCLIVFASVNVFGATLGDVNEDNRVNLEDVISVLQVCAGLEPPKVNTSGDVNNDGKIGLEEALYGLQKVAGIRPDDPNAPLVLPTQSFEQSSEEGVLELSYNSETGKVNFLIAPPEYGISQPMAFASSTTPEEAARSFMSQYQTSFGLTNQAEDLTTSDTSAASQGRTFVRFQQEYMGIPVIGAELVVQMDSADSIMSINGSALPNLSIDTTPQVSMDAATETALVEVAKLYPPKTVLDFRANIPELRIYNPLVLDFPGARENMLVWQIEVTPYSTDDAIREWVLVDAISGNMILHVDKLDRLKNRLIYNSQNTDYKGTLVRTEGGPATSNSDVNKAYDYSGNTYDFYKNENGRDSIDNKGMNLVSSVHFSTGFCNAFWNGYQMVYGDGCSIVADDVVAHEMTHGVTQYESGLVYSYQSGAINESFSDIWGEWVDQTNGLGNDTASVKWLMGEDITGVGPFRSLKDPTAYGNPDRITSPLYICDSRDNGGVHYNSGVGNKAAYLMTDGGTFNGYTVTGLGYAKVADLFYEVQANILTQNATYPDLYKSLLVACSNLRYSASDCQQVQNALDAVEMYLQPCKTVYTISGNARDANNNPLSGVKIVLPGVMSSAITDSSGYYSKKVNGGLNGTATASRTGYSFSSRPYSGVNSNLYSENYTAISTCTINLSSSASIFFSSSGGSGSVNVTVSAGCAWNAVSNASWITTGSSGNGNGTVYYSVAQNTGTSSRTGTINIGSKTFIVNQAGSTCYYTLSSTSKAFNYSGGTQSFSLYSTPASGCSWTAVSNASWIRINSGMSGNGYGVVTYSVDANSQTPSRTGTITVAEKTFTVTQTGITCSYKISSRSRELYATGGSFNEDVTTLGACGWTATSNSSWIRITSGSSGYGNGKVYYTVDPNTSAYSRTGTLIIAGRTFTVNQLNYDRR